MPIEIQYNKVVKGIKIFLFLSVLGMTIVFYLTGSEETWKILIHSKINYILIAFLLIIVDLVSGAARIHIFLRRIIPQSFRVSFKANLANIFLAAVTPFQTGGGIAQLYVLNYYGAPYAAGLTISVFNFVATLSLLFVSATYVLTNIPARLIDNQSLILVLDMSRFAFYFTLALFFVFLFRPQLLGKFVNTSLKFLVRFFPRWKGKVEGAGKKILGFIEQYQQYLAHYWKKEKLTLVWNIVLTVILYFNKCLVAYVILLALGLQVPFWDVIMLQMLVIFFLYFAPTPGASLVAETGMSAVMSLVLPAYSLSIFTVLWRFFTTYFSVFLGSLVLLNTLRSSRVKSHAVAEYNIIQKSLEKTNP